VALLLGLAVATFVGLMLLPTLAPAWRTAIPAVWDLPVPPPPADAGPSVDEMRTRRLQVTAPRNLIDTTWFREHHHVELADEALAPIRDYLHRPLAVADPTMQPPLLFDPEVDPDR